MDTKYRLIWTILFFDSTCRLRVLILFCSKMSPSSLTKCSNRLLNKWFDVSKRLELIETTVQLFCSRMCLSVYLFICSYIYLSLFLSLSLSLSHSLFHSLYPLSVSLTLSFSVLITYWDDLDITLHTQHRSSSLLFICARRTHLHKFGL